MNYFVFEAGGRAGISAELFFLRRQGAGNGDHLFMADMDKTSLLCPSSSEVTRIEEVAALEMIDKDSAGCTVFPADELARQGKPIVTALADKNPFAAVDSWFYDKRQMNVNLARATEGCQIKIPRTFSLDNVFMRPNKMSAGSHGVGRLPDTCITEYVEIEHEYVVDVNGTLSEPVIYAREVKIKNGYDKYLNFKGKDSKIAIAVKEFVKAISASYPKMTTGIFHIQLIENKRGDIYFVEYSKRISGTSIVNLYRGYNPFDAIAAKETPVYHGDFAREETWYRYEDFVLNLYSVR